MNDAGEDGVFEVGEHIYGACRFVITLDRRAQGDPHVLVAHKEEPGAGTCKSRMSSSK